MASTLSPRTDGMAVSDHSARAKSAASWGAIFAGALVAIAVSLILLALGTGLGFASVSPWSDQGVGAGTFSVAAAIWLIVMQWVSALFGGYMAGRLRTRWVGTHAHEIFFRDTAHGFVTWALATVVVSTLVVSAASSGASGAAKALSGVVAAGAQGASQGAASSGTASGAAGDFSYGVDKLFRSGSPGAQGNAAGQGGTDPRVEAGRILVTDMANGSVPDADRTYLAGLVAAHTGMTEADAQKRVDDLIASANDAKNKLKAQADAARKDAAQIAMYTALSLLVGAFIASVAAALGGRLRDEHP